MPSRATSIDRKDWRSWLLDDYARYWYALGVVLIMVFGVGELARVAGPLDAAEGAALFALFLLLTALGLSGYALLWRRDGPLAVALFGLW